MGAHNTNHLVHPATGATEEHRQFKQCLHSLHWLLLLLRPKSDWRIEGASDVGRLEGSCELVATLWPLAMPAHLQHGPVLSNATVRGFRDNAGSLAGSHEPGSEVSHVDLHNRLHYGRILRLRSILHAGILRYVGKSISIYRSISITVTGEQD